MKKSKSSHRWLKEHFSDPFVKKAQKEGYRSRAVYKLLEIQEKDRIIKPGMTLIDLGAAPGGWTEVAVKLVGKQGKVFALDILPMMPVEGAECIQGDFTDPEVYQALLAKLPEQKADIVLSDMAPNMSGVKAVDQPRAMYLAELAFAFAQDTLKPGGTFLAKIFQGAGFDEFMKDCRQQFQSVKIRKPDASRGRSAEIYLLAIGFKA